MNNITGKELLKKLKSLNLPSEDYAIFGSGPMYPRGIKELGHDIDLVAKGKAWEIATTLGKVELTTSGLNKVVVLLDGEIEIFNGWWPGEWNIDDLIDTADIFDGIRYVNLQNLLKWKKVMGRPKDFEHIKLVEEYLKNQPNSAT